MHGFTLLLVLRLQFHGPSSRLLLRICRKYPCLPWPLTCLAKSQSWINRLSLPFQACNHATEYLWRKTHSHVLSYFKFRAVKLSGFLKWLEWESEAAQSCLTLCDPMDQAPLSMEFYRQEEWSGLPFPSPGNLPNPGIEPGSPTLQADALPSEPLGKPWKC